MVHLNNLVIVPGHAVYQGKEAAHGQDDGFWTGRFGGYDEAKVYMAHVRQGVLEAAKDDRAMLVFSGGQTREEAGQVSEADGMYALCEQHGWFGNDDVKLRAHKEEYARDSFENLEFSILLFRKITAKMPEKVTVCGFEFKKERYALHAKTLGIDVSRFNYVGVNDPPEEVLAGGSRRGEEVALLQFKENPRGDSGPLFEKRMRRDPFMRGHPYK